jgi:hypothetical protein
VHRAAQANVGDAERRFEQALADGPLAAVVAWAELEPDEARVLALCAAVELDRRLQHLVDALAGRPAAGRLTVELLIRLLGPPAVAALHDDSGLSRAALLDLEPGVPFAAAHIAVPRQVVWALLDTVGLDPELPPGAEVVTVDARQIGAYDMVLVSGADRVRRIETAAVAASGLAFLVSEPPEDEDRWRVLVRQASVAGLGVILELDGPPSALARRWIERADHLSFGLCTRHPLPLDSVPHREFGEIVTADPAVTDREWAEAFPGAPAPRRRPSAEQLRLARQVSGTLTDPDAAIRRVTNAALLRHATRVHPRVGWDELVLPVAQQRQLRGLVDRYRQRGIVHDGWGLPLYPSPGVVAMFAGPSGTGKTTAAEVIAHDLGVEMFRVDLSALVSKYIGETEKNLEEIFSAAHAGDCLLLFDEADALFGSRSKVTDARDRYANMEVSYLLQRLESFDGFVILTSNFQGNIDEAFLRRIHVTVHFAVPSEADRRRIWERALGEAPQQDLDLDFVAAKFDLTGGSIRLAALSAAFLAAARGTPVGMVEVLQAIRGELTKLRRRPSDDQFGRWLPELQAAEPSEQPVRFGAS